MECFGNMDSLNIQDSVFTCGIPYLALIVSTIAFVDTMGASPRNTMRCCCSSHQCNNVVMKIVCG